MWIEIGTPRQSLPYRAVILRVRMWIEMTTMLRARRTLLGHPPCEGALLIIFTSKAYKKTPV